MAKRMRESRGLGKYDAPLKLQHQMGYSGFKRGRIANPFSEDTMQYREIANKVKKLIRDGPANRPTDWRQQISDELGDVLWYCAALATDLNLTLGAVAGENLNKLSVRKEAGTIGGSGDKR